jgi:NDP-sugar pyrophosphorylase family protein
MKAMILAAGLGTRLRPITDHRPKALVELGGRTLLEIILSRLRSFGVSEVIINVHHFAGMVVDYLKSKNNFGMRIEISREDDLLLDSGGGLKKASWFFLENSRHSPLTTRHSLTEPFLLHNVDVISNIDFRRMLQFHNENGALATLSVQSRPSSRLLLFTSQNQLVGRQAASQKGVISSDSPLVYPEPRRATRLPRGSRGHSPLAFSGIHVISPRLLSMLTEEGVFSIIDSYLRLAAQGEKILAFRADEYYWRDLGRPSDLSQAALDLQQRKL